MQKSFKILFYTFLGLFCGGVIYLTAVMFFSPRQDIKERGFIPCTKQLVINLQKCKAGSIGCPFKLLATDMWCNINVVYRGAADWIVGKQPTPWANYLFEPEIYYDAANAQADETISNLQHDFIEQKQKELEEAKHRQLKINPDELLQDPDLPVGESINEAEETDEDIPQGDISAETDISIEPITTIGLKNAAAPNEPNLLHKIKKQTDEKLQKGNLKDEK